MTARRLATSCLALMTLTSPALAKEWFVAPGGSGNGDAGTPFGKIQQGLDAAQPGDTVTVKAGTYAELLVTKTAGTQAAPITLRAEPGGGEVLVSATGQLLTISHPYFVVESLVLDGKYGNFDLVKVADAADGLVLSKTEIRKATKDCVDMGGPKDVVIEGCHIHHCLNAANTQTDAHGITGGPVQNLVIRDTEINLMSGDAIQFDPGREMPGWNDIRVERCKLWTGPLPTPENGFSAGTVPGENAFDTKTNPSAPRAKLTIVDTTAWGFRKGLIGNMAAFNMKENVDVLLDRVTVHDSEIAFRTRGPGANGGAWVRIQNAVVYDVDKAVRYEDGIEKILVYNTTFGAGVLEAFEPASAGSAKPDVKNLLLLGTALPAQATGSSNLAVAGSVFVNAGADDYHLAKGSSPIDKGETLAGVTADRDNTPRPQGPGFDVGAYEDCEPPACGSSTGGTGGSSSGGTSAGGSASGGTSGGGTSSGGTSAGGTASGGTSTGGAAASDDSGDDGGCGCRTAPRSGPRLLLALALLLPLLRRRRA